MSSLVASAWLDKDLKYTLRFVSKSVFGFLATIALVLRTVEWSKYKDKEPKSCQNICIGVTGKNPDFPTFNAGDEKDCDTQELALNKRFAGHSILIFLRGHSTTTGTKFCNPPSPCPRRVFSHVKLYQSIPFLIYPYTYLITLFYKLNYYCVFVMQVSFCLKVVLKS